MSLGIQEVRGLSFLAGIASQLRWMETDQDWESLNASCVTSSLTPHDLSQLKISTVAMVCTAACMAVAVFTRLRKRKHRDPDFGRLGNRSRRGGVRCAFFLQALGCLPPQIKDRELVACFHQIGRHGGGHAARAD